MSWWKKKSNYKPAENRYWFDEDDYQPTQVQTWNRGYTWKPKYDMSMSLEMRVTQLIKTITGKNLKLQQAEGWGNDDKYFYYNASDLREATDDEVLGRILQQLGKEMYIDRERVTVKNENEPSYKHLLDSLEANRADKQLAMRYTGTTYYASELWNVRKFKDNPIVKYVKPQTFEEFCKDNYAREITDYSSSDKEFIKREYEGYLKNNTVQQNDAWEFCFNIHALQNGETNFDFSKDAVADGFTKALPSIVKYLEAPSFNEALQVYPEIQKYYPIPNKEQQEQMDKEMGSTQGLSQQRLKQLADQMAEIAAGQDSAGREVDGAKAFGLKTKAGKKGSLDHEDYVVQRELQAYKQAKKKLAPVIGVLHSLISSILKDNAVKRYARPFKRGKIDGKRMYKYIATDNLRIFKKAKAISKKDYTMAILLDQSGSMAGGNSDNAFYGAVVLAEVFEQLGMPYEVLGFRDEVYVYKQFNKSLERAVLPSIARTGGGTDDLNAIKVLRNHIKNFDPSRRYRKGVFVITDGEGSDPRATKELVDQIEKLENTTVFGLGIGDVEERNLAATYNHYLKVDDVNGLPSTLVNLMKTQFRRG